jgi:hypothetical protein
VESVEVCVGSGFGCTDATACNFNPDATSDDGTCEYTSCVGCTDPEACNYDPSATSDDGSCALPDPVNGCVECDFEVGIVEPNLGSSATGTPVSFVACGELASLEVTLVWTNLAGDGSWPSDLLLDLVAPNGACLGIGGYDVASGCATTVGWPAGWNTSASGTYTTVVDVSTFGLSGGGDWSATLTNGWTFSSGAGYDLTFSVMGLCNTPECATDVLGCTEVLACNFNELATVDDGSCTFPFDIVYEDVDGDGIGGDAAIADWCPPLGVGLSLVTGDCDDTDASVFPGAPGTGQGVDNNCDGEVVGDEQAPCPYDLNNDGTISVADILALLGQFGCSGGCSADLDGDDTVSVSDILVLLSFFGTSC